MTISPLILYLFIYLGFYVAFNTVQVISRRVVGRAEETSTYSSLGFCTVNCRPTASNYQLSHLRPCRESNPVLRGGRRECYHSATVAPSYSFTRVFSVRLGGVRSNLLGGMFVQLWQIYFSFHLKIVRGLFSAILYFSQK